MQPEFTAGDLWLMVLGGVIAYGMALFFYLIIKGIAQYKKDK